MLTSNAMEKNKKKTLTISSNFKRKIDTSSLTTDKRKSFSVQKKNHTSLTKILINLTKERTLKLSMKIPKKILQGK